MTSTETRRPSLPKGGNRAAEQQLADKEARKSSFSSFNDWEYLRLAAPADGEREGASGIYRFVTPEDEWVETKKHNFINTKPAPADTPEDKLKKWPKKMGAVCRHAPGFDEIYDECFICDYTENEKGKRPYAGLRLLALAVEREEAVGTQEMYEDGLISEDLIGEPVYVDKTHQRPIWEDGKDTGKTETVKNFVVAEFGLDNFFNKLIGFNNVYKTVLDRDYLITRIGSGTDTDYSIVGLDVYLAADGKKYDLRRPEIAKLYENNIDLQKIFEDQATDEFYERFFDTRVDVSYSTAKSGAANSAAKPTDTEETKAAKTTIDAMRARLLDKSKS